MALLSFILIMMFSSYLHAGLCDDLDKILPGLGEVVFLQDAQCMQKLLPCQDYVKAPSSTPPQACCAPLKEIHEQDSKCLCNFITNPQLLQTISVSKEDVMKLPEACGMKVRIDQCNNTGGTQSPGAATAAAEGESSVPDRDTAEAKESSSSTKMVTPYGVALLTALVFSAY